MGPTGTGAIADNSGNIVQSGVTQTVVKKLIQNTCCFCTINYFSYNKCTILYYMDYTIFLISLKNNII